MPDTSRDILASPLPGGTPKASRSLPTVTARSWSRSSSESQTARTQAALAVNRHLLDLYWGIGREIAAQQAAHGWETVS